MQNIGNRITRIANNQDLQNEFFMKYNRFIDDVLNLDTKIYDKEQTRGNIENFLDDTISSLKECRKFIHDIEVNDDYENDIEIPFKLECIECGTELKPFQLNYCDNCLEDKINEFEYDNNLM